MKRRWKWWLWRIVRSIDDFFGWSPEHIFYTTTSTWRSYDKPELECGLFGSYTTHGTFHDRTNFTKLGKFMDHLPILVEGVCKAPYYIIVWPIWLCLGFCWEVFKGIFVPQSW